MSEDFSLVAKNASEAVKNFFSIINEILQPRGLDLAIAEGHKKIIESFVTRDDYDELTKVAFVSGYKRMVKEYKNCAKTAQLAAQHISNNSKPQDVDQDWFAFFFDKVRLVSNESVQEMWAQILANEVNQPGTYQRALLHILSIMSTSQAQLFCNLSRFCMYEYKKEDCVHPLLFVSKNVKAYEKSKVFVSGLLELENLGLIQCDFKDEFVFQKKKVFRYGNKILEVYGDPANGDKIYAGNVCFTKNGLALFGIVSDAFKQYRVDILDFTIARFQLRNCTVYLNNKKVT